MNTDDWSPALRPDLSVGAQFTMSEPRPWWQRALSVLHPPWRRPRVRRFTITHSTLNPQQEGKERGE